MKYILSIALLIAVSGLCGCGSDATPKVQCSGVGYVRSVNDGWAYEMVFESGDGAVKGYEFCRHESDPPLWKGEHVEFYYSWNNDDSCYHFISAKHLPPDAKP